MRFASTQSRSVAKACTLRMIRRIASAGAVAAVVATAVGLPVIAPETTDGGSPMVAIARADCPPDCGGGPGNGGMPSGPPGGGTEFVPPSIPAMPSYDPGRGQPPLDQNNGISIYNSAAPQPSQAAEPSQAPVQNQDGSYNRAANGEQQPINHNAPNNQQLNNNWQKLSDQLNNQQGQPEQNLEQTDNSEQQKKEADCEGSFSLNGGGVSGAGQSYVDVMNDPLPGSQLSPAPGSTVLTSVGPGTIASRYVKGGLFGALPKPGAASAGRYPQVIDIDPGQQPQTVGQWSPNVVDGGPVSGGARLPVGTATDESTGRARTVDITGGKYYRVRISRAVPVAVTNLCNGLQKVDYRLEYQFQTSWHADVNGVPIVGNYTPQDWSDAGPAEMDFLTKSKVLFPSLPSP